MTLFVSFIFWYGYLNGCIAISKHISRVLTERKMDKKRFREISSPKITPGGPQKYRRGIPLGALPVGTTGVSPLCPGGEISIPQAL